MLTAFVTSTLFLISYLYYHLVLRAGVTHFQGEGVWRPVYFAILLSHTFLAVVVVPVHPGHALPRAQGQLRAPQGDRPLHLPDLAVRLGYRGGDLRHVVQDFRRVGYGDCLCAGSGTALAVQLV